MGNDSGEVWEGRGLDRETTIAVRHTNEQMIGDMHLRLHVY